MENLQVNSSANKFSRGNLYRFGCHISFPLVHVIGKPVTIMEDVRVYMVVNLEIEDKDTYLKYEKGFFPILKRHGGEFLTFDDSFRHLEGSEPLSGGRVVIFSFPSEAAAEAWYNDPEYQELSKYRREGAPLRSLSLVKGLPPRS